MTLRVDRFMRLNKRERRARFGDDDYASTLGRGQGTEQFDAHKQEMRTALHEDENEDEAIERLRRPKVVATE